ncbi:ADAMTS-like protein 4 [Amyelois transitella]|uniref:ADAMTS-like protein 4 n=1 Tax=Amyelois transitella TaxID=680683 RepID=UPI00299007CE|nr:ADAMTS-like protein 4 [Amyelois transitella]
MVASGLLLMVLCVVGRDTVLATTGSRESRCGRRLVSGLFSRPRLPLGYSYVTTVPRGACRLNVSEIVPNENYIALKISNGSYVMNGEFAISPPGTYEAVGTRFIYTRNIGLDSVYAPGPLHQSVDIMVLYTQPNPSITYEYFTESSPIDIEVESVTKANIPPIKPSLPKHTRRHHSFDVYRPGISIPRFLDNDSKETSAEEGIENVVGTRRFTWKILSYTQCTRTCGGGIQLGKFRCVETTSGVDREISPIHCSGPAPAGRRRRCGTAPCPPRWRAAAWSTCPECGPAARTRIVGCVQDHARGITKVSDQKCTSQRPATMESCDIPDCEATQSEKRVIRPREHTDHFRDGPVYTVAPNSNDLDIGPEYTFNAAAGWLYTEWTECVGWHVGGGIQTRGVRCADPSGCAPRKAPESSRSCTPKFDGEVHGGHWFTGDWSPCTSSCTGKQIRGVLCIGNNGRHMKDAACKDPRPAHERDCRGDCAATWYFSDWGECTGNCSSVTGIQRRSLVCSKDEGASTDLECTGMKPENNKECELHCPPKIFPPDITIEAQKTSVFAVTTTTTTSTTTTVKPTTKAHPQDCEDKLYNCGLAVQARLCHYNYYVQNCCNSCRGR